MAKQLWAEGGAAAFFRGGRARMAAHAPSVAVSWATYEAVKALLLGGSVSVGGVTIAGGGSGDGSATGRHGNDS